MAEAPLSIVHDVDRLHNALVARWSDRLLTPLPSRWNGKVILIEDEENSGLFRSDGSIGLLAALVRLPLRWPTLLHELLHSYSAGGGTQDYSVHRGWEEGPVEALQRLLIRVLLTDIGEPVDEISLQDREAGWRFNAYLPVIESVREAIGVGDAERFYVELLKVPIIARRQRLSLEAVRNGNIEAARIIGRCDIYLRRNLGLPGG
jgi:hypothetical protein